MEQIENRMVVDSEWRAFAKELIEESKEKLNGPGWEEIGTGIFVSEEDAYDYAMERVSQDVDLQKEFKETVVGWFYSGNWIKEDGDGTD